MDDSFKLPQAEEGMSKLAALFKTQIDGASQAFTKWFSLSSAVTFGISEAKEAISELIEIDSALTEIGRTSALTGQQLEDLGDHAFDMASKYGMSAASYLASVQEMLRAGFDNAEGMAELSLLAQAAGGMAPNAAEDYLTAADRAYRLGGSVGELTRMLDSQSYVAGRASVSLQDMAAATSEAAFTAARCGISIDELSALIAVASSNTKKSGHEVGAALNGIFTVLQDAGDGAAADALGSLGISMTETIASSEKLKTPIGLLKELSSAFRELPEGGAGRTGILDGIGAGDNADALSAILSNWESYESMLGLYSQGAGNAAREARENAGDMEGSLNRLANTWTDTIGNVATPSAILTAVNALNDLLSIINKITGVLGPLGTAGLGAGLFAGIQNIGKAV